MTTPTMDLRDAVTLHQLTLQSEGRSPTTLRHYLFFEKRFLEYLDDQRIEPTLDALNTLNVRAAIEWYRGRGSHGARGGQVSLAAFVETLKTLANFLVAEEVYADSPLRNLKPVRVPKVLRQPFTEQEIMALWGAAQQTRTPLRDEAMLLLLLGSGIRIGELCTLTLDKLKLDERHIVVGLEGKGRRERIVPIGVPTKVGGGRTMAALRAYLKERQSIVERYPSRATDRVFLTQQGFALTAEGGTDVIKHLGKVAGVTNAIPHRARHTFATHYLTALPGDEIGLRRIIGHASADVLRDYVHLAQTTIAGRAGHASIVETMATTPKLDPRVQERIRAQQRRRQRTQDAWDAVREAPEIPPAPKPDRREVIQRARAVPPVFDRTAMIEALKSDPELRKALLQALSGAA